MRNSGNLAVRERPGACQGSEGGACEIGTSRLVFAGVCLVDGIMKPCRQKYRPRGCGVVLFVKGLERGEHFRKMHARVVFPMRLLVTRQQIFAQCCVSGQQRVPGAHETRAYFVRAFPQWHPQPAVYQDACQLRPAHLARTCTNQPLVPIRGNVVVVGIEGTRTYAGFRRKIVKFRQRSVRN